jgi:hypothetical protein
MVQKRIVTYRIRLNQCVISIFISELGLKSLLDIYIWVAFIVLIYTCAFTIDDGSLIWALICSFIHLLII